MSFFSKGRDQHISVEQEHPSSPRAAGPHLAVLVSGTGSVLEAIISQGISIRVVIADRACRGLIVAQEHKISTLLMSRTDWVRPDSGTDKFDRDGYSENLGNMLDTLGVDVVAMAGFGTILTEKFFSSGYGRYRHCTLNTHPSLLPSFPGWHAVRDSLAAKATETGCTVHVAQREVDSGPILAQRSVPVLLDDTEQTLHERIKRAERELYPEAIVEFMSAVAKTQAPSHQVSLVRGHFAAQSDTSQRLLEQWITEIVAQEQNMKKLARMGAYNSWQAQRFETRHNFHSLRAALLSNSSLSDRNVEKLLANYAVSGLEAATGLEHFTDLGLRRLVAWSRGNTMEAYRVPVVAAVHPAASEELIRELAADEQPAVRAAAAKNRSAPEDLLVLLAFDADQIVRESAAAELQRRGSADLIPQNCDMETVGGL